MTQTYTRLAAALAAITSRVRTDVTAVKGADGRQAWTQDPLTPDRVARHLNGGPARGVCPIKAGESVTMVGLLDLDSHGGETSWTDMAWIGGQVMDSLVMLGGEPVAFRSSGGRGIHIYCLWDEPQDAYSVRTWLKRALAGVGLGVGVRGVARGQVEVFPKQDRVPADGYGSQFILPLAGASVPLVVCELSGLLVDAPGGRESVVGMRWGMSEPVPVRVRPERVVGRSGGLALAGGGTGLGADLLAALDTLNRGGNDLDYDEWRNVVFAIHHETGGSDEGLALAHAVSARSVLYDPDFLDERVWPYVRSDGRDSAITGRSVLALARDRYGWQDPSVVGVLSAFSVVVPPPGSPGGAGGPPPLPAFTMTRGKIDPTVTNAIMAVRRGDLVGVQVGHDMFKDEVMVAAEGAPAGDGWRAMQDWDLVEIRSRMETLGFKTAPKELARDAVVAVCNENRFDSAVMWLERVEREVAAQGYVFGRGKGGGRGIDTFLVDYFGCADTPYVRACGRYLWTALAARVMSPGCQVDMIVTLAGGQGLLKSSAVAAMVPSPEFCAEIDFGQREEDTARLMRGVLVGEVAELRGLRSKDADGIKKFITRRWEKWVPKYKEFATAFGRRTVFVGTVNPDSVGFLGDETGERRWLPVEVARADVEGIVAARERLWAEGLAVWRESGVAWQDAEMLAAPMHEQFSMADMWDDRVCDWLDGTDGLARGEGDEPQLVPRGQAPGGFRLDELASGLGIPARECDMRVQKRLGAILVRLGYAKRNLRIGGRQGWRWLPKRADITLPPAPPVKTQG